MHDKGSKQECEQILRKLGFNGDYGQFGKGNCQVRIIGDMIRLSVNVPGVEKEYVGPPLPTAEDLEKLILRHAVDEE